MPTYSHSRLSTYEECPLKFKLKYIDKIEREEEGIEAFVGSRVHETLKKCYDDFRLTKLNSLTDLISYYDNIWQQNWHNDVITTKKDMKPEHYQLLGKNMIETYYQRFMPFDQDITIDTEMRLMFALDEGNKYKLTGFIDRLSKTEDGIYQIHDYKTSAHLPGQDIADKDRQLALYQIGIQKKWPDVNRVMLVWHYLAHQQELVSLRSEQQLTSLADDVIRLIDEIECAEEYPAKESAFCNWCEYPDLCPKRKHFYTIELLPANEYLKEPGVVLVNKYAELKSQADEIGKEMDKVKEAIIEYARKEGVEAIRGSDRKASVKIEEKFKFPRKSDPERKELDTALIKAGKWQDVSELDTTALTRIIGSGKWEQKTIDEVMRYGHFEESVSIRLSKLNEVEE